MKLEIETYVKNVKKLVELKESLGDNPELKEDLSRKELEDFISKFTQGLQEAIVQAEFYIKEDLSQYSGNALRDLKAQFEAWKNWGYSNKTKPNEIVRKINEELQNREKYMKAF